MTARRFSLLGSAALVAAVTPAAAQVRHFDVPAQAAVTGIPLFAHQAGIQILASGDLLSGVPVNAVRGDMDTSAALRRLIAHTGLTPTTVGAAIVLHRGVTPIAAMSTGSVAPPASAPAAAPSDPAPATPAVPAQATAAADIVVTGSRVISNGNNSPTPVTVVSTNELLKAQPAGVVAALNELPALLGSTNTTSSVNTGGFNQINLRGVGPTRALILIDGNRVPPSRATGAVNADVIPQILLQRVEVVTGGVSAVYGSDAVAGVVNFITDTKFQGFKANIQRGISTYGDDGKLDAGLAYGRSFAGGRGHVEIGYEYRDNDGIIGRDSRPFLNPRVSEAGAVAQPVNGVSYAPGTAQNPFSLVQNATLSTASFGGRINSGPLAGLQFAQNGALSPFVNGQATGTAGVQIGGDGAYFVGNSLASPQRIHQGYTRVDYELSDHLRAHASFGGTDLSQHYIGQNLYLNGVAIGYNNAFLTGLGQPYQAIIAAQPAGSSFAFGKMVTDVPNYRYDTTQRFYQAAGGLDGDLGTFKWNLDYAHSYSEERTVNTNNVNTARLYAALNSVEVNGQAVCNAALANPAAYGGCVPFNAFGPTAANGAAVNYIEQATHSNQMFGLNSVGGAVKGAPVDLPAGPLNVALSAEWRRLTYQITSDAQPTDAVDCTGIQFNCTSTTTPYLGGSVTALRPVSQTVAEGAIEVNAPLLADRPFVKSLSLNGAGRYTHYNSSGGVWTWKVGLDWQVNDDIHLRATRSRDIRAPNLIELYAPPTYSLKNYADAHTGTQGLVNMITQGNPDLTPEKANTWTAGLVYKPGFVRGLSLAVDYYRIDIRNAITSIDAFSPATQQSCEASGGSAAVCALYVRPLPFSDTSSANFPTLLYAETLNVASVKTYGVDFETNYATRLFDRALALRGLVTWQPHLIYNNGPSGTVDVGGAADGIGGLPTIPSVKVLASVSYDLVDKVNLRVQERWRNALRQNGNPALVFVQGKIPSVGYTDLTLTFDVNRSFQMFFNVLNLFNTYPPATASAAGSVQINYLGGFAQGDDIEGRYITAGVRLRL